MRENVGRGLILSGNLNHDKLPLYTRMESSVWREAIQNKGDQL